MMEFSQIMLQMFESVLPWIFMGIILFTLIVALYGLVKGVRTRSSEDRGKENLVITNNPKQRKPL